MSYRSCPECGARLASGAQHCDLCGAPLEADSGEAAPSSGAHPSGGGGRPDADAPEGGGSGPSRRDRAESAPADDIPDPSTSIRSESEALDCPACGAANVPDSNFCSQCGARLHRIATPITGPQAAGTSVAGAPPTGGSVPGASPAGASARPPERGRLSEGAAPGDDAESRSDLTRQVAILFGLAVLVVVALYMITVVSKQQAPPDSESAVSAPAEARAASIIQQHEAIPISEVYRARADSLRRIIEEADAAESVRARRRLVDFLIGIGRIDRAAIEQQRVAHITDEAPDWRKAANLLFDWMETTEPDSKSRVALLAIDAYKQVLQQQPDDLDARADLGWVYQYDPQNPMEAIRHTNLVLDEDPQHLTANYNKGVFLMRINRIDDALRQFEHVKTIAGAGSPYHRQAEMWIDTIRETQERREAG